ncbi:hypothetical protein AT705_09975 [Pseudoalteromonas rubra]|uniref:EpsG family protein n=1 Tax=Pseudoalteromonas rubra TaxID=43658 RepID=A0A0U3HQJ7_9GAMM|nr:hypothetical protein AT705_09975 [Pseudoalteromonas rubra]
MVFLLSKTSFKLGNLIFLVLSLPFVLFVGFRGGTPDTQIYYNVLANIDKLDLLNPFVFYQQTGMEIGFGWYAWAISLFTSSNVLLFSIFSILNFYFLYKSSRLLKVNYLFVLVFYLPSAYFFLQQLMQMRQGLAIAITLYAIVRFIYKRELLVSFLLFVVGFLFHQTALFLLVFSVFFYFADSFSKRSRIDFFLLNFFFLVVFIIFFKFFLLDFLIGLSPRLQAYASSDNFSSSVSVINPQVIKTILIIFFVGLCAGPALRRKKAYRYFLYLEFLSLAIRIGFSDFAIMSGRLSTVFSHAEVFILPLVFRDRIGAVAKLFILPAYIALQSVITLQMQAPYLLEFYSKPLSLMKNV